MPFTPTDWNPGAAPGISAAELDRIEAGINDLYTYLEWTPTPHEVAGQNNAATGIAVSTASPTWTNIVTVAMSIPAGWDSYRVQAMGAFTIATGSIIRTRIVRGTTALSGGQDRLEVSAGDKVTIVRFVMTSEFETGDIGGVPNFILQATKDVGTDPNWTAYNRSLAVRLTGLRAP